MDNRFSLASYLRTLVYFESMDAAVLDRLVHRAIRRTFASGQTLFLEGDAAEGLWLIELGRVKVFKVNADGQEHVMRIFGDRDTFNDIGAFDGGVNPANAAALSDVTAWIIPGDVLREMVMNDGKFAMQVIRVLSGRVRGLIRQIEDLTLYSVIVRLARFLLHQTDNPALTGPGVTRATIAAHLATTPPTISTALRELEQSGAIRFDRQRVQIIREDILRSIAMM